MGKGLNIFEKTIFIYVKTWFVYNTKIITILI